MIFWFVLWLLICRVIGMPFLLVAFVASKFYSEQREDWPKWILVMGFLTDVVMGSRFGTSVLLYLLMLVQTTFYTEKVESASGASMLLLVVISLVEAALFWQIEMTIWRYVLGVVAGYVFWLLSLAMEKRGFGKGVYLRGRN